MKMKRLIIQTGCIILFLIATISAQAQNEQTQEMMEKTLMHWKMLATMLGVLLLLLILALWFRRGLKTQKEKNAKKHGATTTAESSGEVPNMVIRRKTTSILKKQSLEDVQGNPSYYHLDTADFCDDSAVRRIYIKSDCIKEIHDIYAKDQEQDNTPEYGCMVLGRWVHDNTNGEYYVSLEHVILPGDDAIFDEYSLNFGAKIKMKVYDKLRKLRRETNLQYDLTCWVHSHPGLTVFFSNDDVNVQNQLKHPTHPNFLTAIVIDTMTEGQQLGIFTFRHDGTLNAEPDLTKMYSLDELYLWALEHDHQTSEQDTDYYDVLRKAEKHHLECNSIKLNNNVIEAMDKQKSNEQSGMLGLLYGKLAVEDDKLDCIVTNLTIDASVPDCELLGCFVADSLLSIPSIRKTVADKMPAIRFVLAYSTSDGTLTAIPTEKMDLCTDDSFYSEQKFEKLIKWTKKNSSEPATEPAAGSQE